MQEIISTWLINDNGEGKLRPIFDLICPCLYRVDLLIHNISKLKDTWIDRMMVVFNLIIMKRKSLRDC